MTDLTHRWSAHDMSTVDGLPYVGRYHPRARHLWVATGFGAWGMTNGTLAGMVLADLIAGRGSQWAALYDPNRAHIRQSARDLVRDNATVARHFAGDRIEAWRRDAADLAPGEAAVCRLGARLAAVRREEDGRLAALSARCTHLGCLVRWNDAERSWDCPCHGSRFDESGEVVEGPATRPLRRLDPG